MFNIRSFNDIHRYSLHYLSQWSAYFKALFMYALMYFFISSPGNIITWAKVASGSMTPSLDTHDITLAVKYHITIADILCVLFNILGGLFYPHSELVREYPILSTIVIRFNTVQHGDIITFCTPGHSVFFTKRVIGCENDKVELHYGNVVINDKYCNYKYAGQMTICENNKEIIGNVLYEQNIMNNASYLILKPLNVTSSIEESTRQFEVPKDCVFVMGDNRFDSSDGRSLISFIPTHMIVNHIPIILLSNSNLTTLGQLLKGFSKRGLHNSLRFTYGTQI